MDLSARPENPDHLHQWLIEALNLQIPRAPLTDGHHAPFDYLRHAFFEETDCVVWAARGSGKTFLGAVATALDLLFKPGIQVRILAGSLEQASRMHAHLRTLFERPILAQRLAGRITDRRIRLHNGSACELLAHSQSSIRGTRVQKIRCDEVELFRPESWEAVQLATRSAVCGGRLVRGTIECLSTMHRPFGLMSELVRSGREGRRALFRWGVVDVLETCPVTRACETCALSTDCAGRARKRPAHESGHLAIDDALRMKGRVSLATWEAEMLCLRPQRSDAVYPEFDRRIHVVDTLPWDRGGEPPVLWVCGMDFGYRAPTVVLWGALDTFGRLWIVDERVAAGQVMDHHAAAIAAAPWPRPAWIACDPAGRQVNDHSGLSSADVLRARGFCVRARPSKVMPGIILVRARLRPASDGPNLLIHRRCVHLIDALERYHYPPDRPDAVEPVKDGPDHAADALRYLVLNLDHPYHTSLGQYAA